MRDIKFRAWDKTSKTMWDGFELTERKFIHPPSATNPPEKCFTFLQYTGLKDKNGVEMYESDIVALENPVYRKKDGTRDGRVPESAQWHEQEIIAWGRWPDFSDGYECEPGEYVGWSINPDQFDQYQVIGNIYENPELLGGGTAVQS